MKYMIHQSHYMTYICKSSHHTSPTLPDLEDSGLVKNDDGQ